MLQMSCPAKQDDTPTVPIRYFCNETRRKRNEADTQGGPNVNAVK